MFIARGHFVRMLFGWCVLAFTCKSCEAASDGRHDLGDVEAAHRVRSAFAVELVVLRACTTRGSRVEGLPRLDGLDGADDLLNFLARHSRLLVNQPCTCFAAGMVERRRG